MQTEEINMRARLSEGILALKLALNQADLKARTFEHEISEISTKTVYRGNIFTRLTTTNCR